MLDVFWYLEQIDKHVSGPDAGLAKRVGDKLKQADALLKTAERGVRAADARVRTTRAQIDTITKTLRAGGTTGKQRQELLAQKARLGRELASRQKAQSAAHKGLDQLKRSRVGDLAVKLRRYPQLKSLGTTLSRLDKLRGQILAFFKHNPAAKRVARGLSLVGLGSELSTYSAWSAEVLANLLRELRKPPPGCLAPFEPPVSSTAGAAATLAAAAPRYEPVPIAIGELPPAITGGRPPAAATALRNELASITALVPAVRAGLDDRSSDPAARASLTRTLPRLRAALAKAGSLRAKLTEALGIAPRTVSAGDLSGYEPQAPSRAALRLLARQGAPPGLRAELRRRFGDRELPTGRLDPAAALADPALGRLEGDLARMLAALG